MSQTSKVLIIGGSSGVGLACAQRLSQQVCYDVVTASRSRSPAIPEQVLEHIVMDVTSDNSVEVALSHAMARLERIDAVIVSSGYSLAGSIEDTSLEEAKAQFETNFWGTVRVAKAIVPIMRAAGTGKLIFLGSLAGLLPLPFQSYYCASKFALEAFCEALHLEVEPWGIEVFLVQPGDLKTNFTSARKLAAGATADSPYFARFQNILQNFQKLESSGQSADEVAKVVERLVLGKSRNLRHRVSMFHEEAGLLLRKVGSEWLYKQAMKRAFER